MALFDTVAGSSTGGILVLGLTKPTGNTRQPAHSAAETVLEIISTGSSAP